MSVPSTVLVSFFEDATKALSTHQSAATDKIQSLADIRQELLQVQMESLQRVVNNFDNDVSIAQVQQELQNIQQQDASIQQANNEMTQAARLGFARLVLTQECRLYYNNDTGTRMLKQSGSMQRSDLIEFCGLLQAAMQLDQVKAHLADGSVPLFGFNNKEQAVPRLAQQRLERIQEFLMRAIGYDPRLGTSEIKRIFFTPDKENEFSQDQEVVQLFGNVLAQMQVILTNAAFQNQTNLDDQQGTRIVSVSYLEKIVDASSQSNSYNNEHESFVGGAPHNNTMTEQQSDQQQQEQLHMARQAAALQQSILGQLESMSEAERNATLEAAKQANDEFLQRAMAIAPGSERVAFMQSMDSETQRQLLMHKLWTTTRSSGRKANK